MSAQVVPIDANADDAIQVLASSDEIIVSPNQVSPWMPEVGDIESQVAGAADPAVYLIPSVVGTPSPSENHELDRDEIQVREKRCWSLGSIALILFIFVLLVIIKFTVF